MPRMAADFITKQLRYANTVTIFNDIPTPMPGFYDIYYDSTTKKVLFSKNGATPTSLSGLNNVSDFKLLFQSINNNILFNVGKTGSTKYDLNSQVTALNMPITSNSASTWEIGIRYTLNTPTTTTTTTTNDLADVFEKNVINVIGNSSTPFNMNTTLNTSSDSCHGILIQANPVSFGNSTNIHCKLAIGASNINMSGVSQDTGDAVFDVSAIDNFGNVHGTNGIYAYIPSNLISKIDKTKAITTYPQSGLWSSLFGNIGDSHIKTFTLRTLKSNIDFASINPKNLKIHYFDGNHPQVVNKTSYNNVIYLNKLPDSTGSFSTGSTIQNDKYEYIICHGDLNIIGGTNNYNAFNFQGLIYCDGNVNVYNVGDQFVLNGIIISKGITNNNVQKWNGITFNDNTINGGNLSDINTILNNITQ